MPGPSDASDRVISHRSATNVLNAADRSSSASAIEPALPMATGEGAPAAGAWALAAVADGVEPAQHGIFVVVDTIEHVHSP